MTVPKNAAATLTWQAATASSRRPAPVALWLGLAAVAAVWFLTLDLRHLLRSDEGRYAEIAREMFESGDWVTIRYQNLKYFEKPPLHLWMTALAYELFGVGAWQARLWVAVSGAAGIGFAAWMARRWLGAGAGLLAALALLAAPTWNLGSHFNSLDMGVSGALAAVLACLLLAQHPGTAAGARRLWMGAAWAAMGLAVLTKGLIGIVLPGIALVLYTLLTRQWVLWTRLQLVSGTLVFLIVTVPWFGLVSQRNPEFPQFFFIHEHWDRYTSAVHQRGAPAWYFVPQLLAGWLPWLGLVPGMWRALRQESAGAGPGFRPLLFCAVWAAGIFAFFSASGSKLPGYILPMFPALALLTAAALLQLDARSWRRQIVFSGALLLAGVAGGVLVGRLGDSNAPATAVLQSYGVWLACACAFGFLGVMQAWRLQRQGRTQASIAVYALAFFTATTFGLLGHEKLGRPASGADLVPAIEKVLKPGMPIYSVRLLDHTLPFYLGRTVVMVEEPDELAFGTQREPQKWLPTMAAFRQAWAGPPALALMSPDTFQDLQSGQLAMQVVARDARRVVVANFPVQTGVSR